MACLKAGSWLNDLVFQDHELDEFAIIEDENENLKGVLPTNYEKFSDDLLRELIRKFSSEEIKNAKGGVAANRQWRVVQCKRQNCKAARGKMRGAGREDFTGWPRLLVCEVSRGAAGSGGW